MYYPYFRGKQYELVAIRENSDKIARAGMIPIIEPVKLNLGSLRRAVQSLAENEARFVLVINPQCGELCENASTLSEQIISDALSDYDNFTIGYIVKMNTDLRVLRRFCASAPRPVSIIHYGFPHGRELAEALGPVRTIREHIFIEEHCTRLYRRHFRNLRRVLIRDGFVQRTNREHPEVEHFSDLHITFADEDVDDFGDFLIVGDEFMEVGGPAYAIAIHLTFIDSSEDNDMFVKHYVSDRTATPTDPGGKFLEALNKLVRDVARSTSRIYRSDAIEEFEDLRRREHYPGLGYVKKLSMQHHIELIADFLER